MKPDIVIKHMLFLKIVRKFGKIKFIALKISPTGILLFFPIYLET